MEAQLARYITEFIGTFFLVLTIGLVVATDQPLAAIAIGSVLMVMVYMGGHVSGAHYNPAVTVALYLARRIPAADLVPYIAAQLAGAITAALVSLSLTGRSFTPAPGADVSALSAVLVEALFTFALALVVLNVAASRATEKNSYFGLAIGFTITAGALAGGPISGGAFNPAVGTGPILVSAIAGQGFASHLWIYLVGPLLGGAMGSAVFAVQEAGRPADRPEELIKSELRS
jgi:aquaporin Z